MVKSDDRPLIIHVLHHLVTGGMENGLVNLINFLPEDQWRHRVLCIEDYSEFRNRIAKPEVEVIALYRSKIGAWRMRKRIFDECRIHRPALVHTRALSGLDALPPAWLAGGAARIHSEHGWDVGDLDGSKRKPALLRRLHSGFVDQYIAVSRNLADYLQAKVGIGEARISQIYNGVDTRVFMPRQAPRTSLLPPSFADPRTLLVGTVGRLQKVKDQATLIRAGSLLRARRPDLAPKLKLAIVGGGPLAGELHQQAGALGMLDSIWFPGGIDRVPEAMRSLDLFVLPSLMEGTSNTILEAMACGLPVLATEVGGNRELVRAGEVGEFFQPGDAEHLSALIERYADHEDLRQRHGQAARELAVREFSLDNMVRRYHEVYRSALRQSA